MNELLIRFYQNMEANTEGRKIADIVAFNDTELEHIHNYIQWIFPIREPSYFNRGYPKLDEETIEYMKADNICMNNMYVCFLRMLEFYGISGGCDDSGYVYFEKSDDFDMRKTRWATGQNHNFLRISRILQCLHIFGRQDLADGFHAFLKVLVSEEPERFNSLAVAYWDAAVKGKSKP